ncbi:MAG TPA: radical SAM family heme chaperone HemW [Leucothrix mucor]|uniref:Heme chaperone HemW n=1 Tax=Leucothrix mucor TaxID=45248 RepID=A0A7V2WVR9_LEUMU|nr:radical SAM family heme chaperone HemW [Leucothrix mucor]
MTPIPLSLYIHIPWCIKKCPYCDFNSHQITGDLPEQAYIQALLKDLENELPAIWGRRLESVFIGGGTPSVFSAKAIEQLLSGLRALLPIRSRMEITLEANPGTFEQQRFEAYRQAGINRLSIGIQSFNANHLKSLGRIHNGEEAAHAAEIAKNAGFENFNLDIMFGLPQQSSTQALADLQQAIDCNAAHISWYQLTLEPNTLFHYAPPVLPNDEALWDMQQQGQALLQKAGFEQYEVSAYARKQAGMDKRCRHNMNYWQFGDYIGIGAGAHGKITAPDGSIQRYSKYRQPKQYMQQVGADNGRSSQQLLEKAEIPFEFMLNALRLKQGVASELFVQRTHLALSEIEGKLEQLAKMGLITFNKQRIVTTSKGWDFLNDTIEAFI